MSSSKILFIMTGSIACYKACQIVSKLSQQGHEVQVVATSSALKFIGNATIEGLTTKPVISDLFSSGNVMDHIHLARWADLVIVAPATADFMNKMAAGIASDLASSLFLAHDFSKPFLVAPAMNTAMYKHPATQDSLKKLLAMGVDVLESASGILACGESGYGRLLEPEKILEAIEKSLELRPQKPAAADVSPLSPKTASSNRPPMKILITAGGTSEPIDDVRVLSNTSSGKTGYRLAHCLLEAGYDVELLLSTSAQTPETQDFPTHRFNDFKSLDQQLQKLLGEEPFTHVIHAAAVSDYSVEAIIVDGQKQPPMAKIDSGREINLRLKPNPKLISKLKSYSQTKNLKVIGFKLTSHMAPDDTIRKVETLMKDADFVVHNDIAGIDKTSGIHKFTLWGLKKPRVYENVDQLSVGIIHALSYEVPL
jgi:phosphopantothenoylcysteine decarboxylase/phosphopantothenate--cysteine ligase